jgi:hypothetical protein
VIFLDIDLFGFLFLFLFFVFILYSIVNLAFVLLSSNVCHFRFSSMSLTDDLLWYLFVTYISLVRPTVEYASPVWDPYLQKNKYKIEMVQRRAARFDTNRYHNKSSVNDSLLRDSRLLAAVTELGKVFHSRIVLG